MSKRFGRNQKRKMRERIADLLQQNRDEGIRRQRAENHMHTMQGRMQYMQERPMLMSVNHGHEEMRENIITFFMQVSRLTVRERGLDSRQVFDWVANELGREIMNDPQLRDFIIPYKAPTWDMGKVSNVL